MNEEHGTGDQSLARMPSVPGSAIQAHLPKAIAGVALDSSMGASSTQFYDMAFKWQFAEKKGSEFQHLFESIMAAKYGEEFRLVKPSGRLGDEKNDGYLPSLDTYFQVYAPSSEKAAVLEAKMNEDFEGAVEKWHVKSWVLVHNNLDGLSSVINHELDDLTARYEGVTAVAWGREVLRQTLFSLPEASIASVLGVWAPTFETMSGLGMADLSSVISHLVSQPDDPLAPVEPVPHDKAVMNCLSSGVEALLAVGMSQMALVESYFKTDPNPELGSRIASALHDEYVRLRASGLDPDDIFQRLWVFAGGRIRSESPKHESAVLAVIAYFFWTCDIFERSARAEGKPR